MLCDLVIFNLYLTSYIFQAVPTSKGQALADEYGIKFFETVSFSWCLLTYKVVGFFLFAENTVYYRVQRQI